MPKFEIKPSDDLTEVAIQIDGIPLQANALQLDALIEGLVAARAQLRPHVPAQPPAGPVQAILDPHYWTKREPDSGMCLLMLRHPGMGWCSFMLPAVERDRLAQYLVNQAQEQGAPTPAAPASSVH